MASGDILQIVIKVKFYVKTGVKKLNWDGVMLKTSKRQSMSHCTPQAQQNTVH